MISSPLSSRLYQRATNGPAFIQARYGSARGLVRLWLSQIARRAGAYRVFEQVRWGEVRRLVFVCSGNICRSPYAEHRAALAGFPAISVALRGDANQPADPTARATARLAGLDLEAHRSTRVVDAGIRRGDLLIAMEPWQARELRVCYPLQDVQVTLLGLWSYPQQPHLHDPFSLSEAYFRTCFRAIDSGVAAILDRVKG
ncbi:MAG TPA: phosphotyrosine protein phosphatase [Allosphingosinicella sp.]|jgi:protein-tyrosine phosphatase|uniref:arsenate reductase/protein-tyrosine-phosphatase family protein n=1 Tax=Allosphingosinicella sp. TaxID=2823234 RepID=UPI002F29685A